MAKICKNKKNHVPRMQKLFPKLENFTMEQNNFHQEQNDLLPQVTRNYNLKHDIHI
jgi:hypothetical protein